MNCDMKQNDDGLWRCETCGWVFPRKIERPPHRNCPEKLGRTNVPGNVLHALLRERIGVDTTKKCNCDEKRILMNMWGPDECRRNLDWIVSGLLDEARKRSWRIDGKPLLTLAARVGTLTPWGIAYARTWARALVTEAIEICERDPNKGA